MRGFARVSRKWWIGSLIAMFLMMPVAPVWADECADAKQALAAAEKELAVLEDAMNQAYDKYAQAKSDLATARSNEAMARFRYRSASERMQDARDRMYKAGQNSTWIGRKLGTPAGSHFEATVADYRLASANLDAAIRELGEAGRAHTRAIGALKTAEANWSAAFKAFYAQQKVVNDAEDWVQRACKKSELESLLDEFGMGGSGVIEEYAGRARDANTEDIAIEAARLRGLDTDDDDGFISGGSTPAGTTAISGTVNCFGNGGSTATVLVNAINVCVAVNTLVINQTFNLNLTPGQVFAITLACSAGGNCQMDLLAAFIGAVCTGLPPGGNLNASGGSQTTASCTAN